MFTRISPYIRRAVAIAAASAVAVIVTLPDAAAENVTGAHNGKTVPKAALLGACDRTAGCGYRTYGNGVTVGCSPTVCFTCNTKVCAAARPKGGQHPVGHLPVGQADAVNGILRAGASTTRRAAVRTGPTLHTGYTNPFGPTIPARSSSHKH